MKIIDEKLLEEFRRLGECEWCGKLCMSREPVHIFSRGAGQLDIRVNLVALGSTRDFDCQCHTDNHAGNRPTHKDLLGLAAKREGWRFQDIELTIWLLRKIGKYWTRGKVREEAEGLTFMARELFFKTLVEAGFWRSDGHSYVSR